MVFVSIKKESWARDVIQVIKCLPSKHAELRSNSSIIKTTKSIGRKSLCDVQGHPKSRAWWSILTLSYLLFKNFHWVWPKIIISFRHTPRQTFIEIPRIHVWGFSLQPLQLETVSSLGKWNVVFLYSRTQISNSIWRSWQVYICQCRQVSKA
jgi:hypothetical protein